MWAARKPFIDQNRAALVDFMEDTLRVRRWYPNPRDHDKVAQKAGAPQPQSYQCLTSMGCNSALSTASAGILNLPRLPEPLRTRLPATHRRPSQPHQSSTASIPRGDRSLIASISALSTISIPSFAPSASKPHDKAAKQEGSAKRSSSSKYLIPVVLAPVSCY
jgi:hypothetical protein